jgi:hypothetical protein
MSTPFSFLDRTLSLDSLDFEDRIEQLKLLLLQENVVFLTQKAAAHDTCGTNVNVLLPNIKLPFYCNACHNKHHILYTVMDETTKFIPHMCHELQFFV